MKSVVAIVLMVAAQASSGFAADSLAPWNADSSAARRDRQLTLIGDTSSPEELARTKARILRHLRDAKQSAVSAMDAQIGRAGDDDEKVRVLREHRDAVIKRWEELEDKVLQLKLKPRTS